MLHFWSHFLITIAPSLTGLFLTVLMCDPNGQLWNAFGVAAVMAAVTPKGAVLCSPCVWWLVEVLHIANPPCSVILPYCSCSLGAVVLHSEFWPVPFIDSAVHVFFVSFMAQRCIRANQICLASIGNAINQTQSIYDASYCFATLQARASEKQREIRLSNCIATTRPQFFADLFDLSFDSFGITFGGILAFEGELFLSLCSNLLEFAHLTP